MEIIVSTQTDPVFNLDLEQRTFNAPAGDVLLFYVNSPCVIVGHNQNPEAEADLRFCDEMGIPVLKRISGGGAVYHDTGNINYSFIVTAGDSVVDRDFLTPVIDVLRKLGVEAVRGARKDLLLGGKKISGTASHVKRERQLFHGTLLYDTDLSMLERALRGDESKRGRKVASVGSSVVNIREYMQWEESAEEFFGRFVSEFKSVFNGD